MTFNKPRRTPVRAAIAIPALILFAAVLIVGYFLVVNDVSVVRAWTIHNMAPIMFAMLILGLLTGYPISFSLAAVGLIFGFIGIELGLFRPDFLQAMTDRVYGTMKNETLLAIPFFTFMGLLLQRSGLAEDLLETIGQLFGSVRGGLAYAVIFVGALLAATTGIVAASVISMGLISLPIMQRYGYGQQTATGVIIASGTLAQVIPPSLVLIVMADQLGVSVGQMYRAALGPGLLLIGMFVLYIFIVSIMRPKEVPALPIEARGPRGGETSLLIILVLSVLVGNLTGWLLPMENASVGLVLNCSVGAGFAILAALVNRHTGISLLSDLAERVILVLVPPLGLIFLVLGTILVGLATPTEGGALGSVGTILLAWFAGRLNWQGFRAAVMSTAELATFVMFILVGARVFSLTFYGVDGHIWVEELLLGIPGGVFGFMVFVSILIFVLGFVLDFYEIAFILLPLLIIPAQSLGIDLVWFGVILAINLQTSFMSPPFGFSLFFLRSVVPTEPYVDEISGETIPGVKTTTIYRGVLPFIGIHILLMILVASFPQTVKFFDRDVVELDSSEVDSELNNIPGFGGMELAPLSFD